MQFVDTAEATEATVCPHFLGIAVKSKDPDSTSVGDVPNNVALFVLYVTTLVYDINPKKCTCYDNYCRCPKETRTQLPNETFSIVYMTPDYDDPSSIKYYKKYINELLPMHLQTLVEDICCTYRVGFCNDERRKKYRVHHSTVPFPISKIMNNEFEDLFSGDLIVDLTGMRYMDVFSHGFNKSIT